MKTTVRSVERIIEEQVQRWEITKTQAKEAQAAPPVVTISREPGSGGRVLAQRLSDHLDFDLFHQEMIHEMAESARVSERMLTTLDEKGLNTLENWISSLVDDQHLWPDEYLQHLMKVVGTIGRHGRAVLVGRGANFILPPEKRFRVRVIASQAKRINRVAKTFKVSARVAKKRIIQTESDRKSFIRKYFHADIADPLNYDMVLNTDVLDMDGCVGSICSALKDRL